MTSHITDIELNNFVLDKIKMYLPPYVRQGNILAFRCPICGDSKKNKFKKRGALYTMPKVNYHCFNCNTSLNGFKFLQFLSGDSFKEIITEYKRIKLNTFAFDNQKRQQLVPEKITEPIPEVTALTNDDLLYLNTRKVTELDFFTALQFRHVKNQIGDFIFIPWLNHGKINSFQLHNYTNIKGVPKYKFQKHADKNVYGLDRIDPTFKYIICFEGVYDSLFVKNGVAIGGTNLMNEQKLLIKNRYPTHEIVISFDSDKAGISAMKKLIAADMSAYKYFIWYNNETAQFKDVNNYIIHLDNVKLFMSDKIESMIYSGIEAQFELTTNNLWTN